MALFKEDKLVVAGVVELLKEPLPLLGAKEALARQSPALEIEQLFGAAITLYNHILFFGDPLEGRFTAGVRAT